MARRSVMSCMSRDEDPRLIRLKDPSRSYCARQVRVFGFDDDEWNLEHCYLALLCIIDIQLIQYEVTRETSGHN